MGERPTLDARRLGKRYPPRAPSCHPNSAQSQARKGARVGLVTGPHAHPSHPKPVGSEPRPDAPKDERSGVGERRTLDAPHLRKKQPPRVPWCHLHSAQSQLARARGVGLVTGPHAHPPHPQPVGSGPRPHAPKDERSGVREHPTPDTPHPGKRSPPRAPSCRLHSAQSQLARARAVGLVTGPLAHCPHPHPVGSRPRPHAPKDERSGVGERPTLDARRLGKRYPPRAPSCHPNSAQSQLARAPGWGW